MITNMTKVCLCIWLPYQTVTRALLISLWQKEKTRGTPSVLLHHSALVVFCGVTEND